MVSNARNAKPKVKRSGSFPVLDATNVVTHAGAESSIVEVGKVTIMRLGKTDAHQSEEASRISDFVGREPVMFWRAQKAH